MGYEVVVESVRKEARKWRGMSDEMAPVADAVGGLALSPLAFLVISPSLMPGFDSVPLSSAYEDMRLATEAQLRGAVVEFDELAGALDKCADAYEEAEKVCKLDFDEIYSK